MLSRTTSLQTTLLSLTAAATTLVAGTASAEPNWAATPTYSTVNLSAGFMPDPWRQSLKAGGSDRVPRRLGDGCTGYINDSAPDVDLNYTAGSGSLFIHASSSADTTLVILDPAGEWHCNDDAFGHDPIVAFHAPRDGNYNIWVGLHGESGLAPAELRITEIDPRSSTSSGAERPNWAAAPMYETVNLTAGFMPDPWSRSLRAGGDHDVAASVGGDCVGYINAAAPDVDLNYESGSSSLYIYALSVADTTIAVLDPAGNWYCNDDGLYLDPVVAIRRPRSGNYNIWLGVRHSARLEPAELYISEVDPR